MYGFSESFNISVAAAVSLNHLVWQMRKLEVLWQLSEDEREDLLLAWVRASSGRKLSSLEELFETTVWDPDKPMDVAELWPDWSQIEPAPQLERGSRRG